ncbi:hypothetical protein AQY21_13660 [Paracoccus sp. MKU1]|nr:hypothetical protein AQY21_13660 [Paracoccus sp. MKU1]
MVSALSRSWSQLPLSRAKRPAIPAGLIADLALQPLPRDRAEDGAADGEAPDLAEAGGLEAGGWLRLERIQVQNHDAKGGRSCASMAAMAFAGPHRFKPPPVGMENCRISVAVVLSSTKPSSAITAERSASPAEGDVRRRPADILRKRPHILQPAANLLAIEIGRRTADHDNV